MYCAACDSTRYKEGKNLQQNQQQKNIHPDNRTGGCAHAREHAKAEKREDGQNGPFPDG